MQHDQAPQSALASNLLALTERLRERQDEDPFGNPVLSVALAISRRIDADGMSLSDLESLVMELRDAGFAVRAARLAQYVGGTDAQANGATLATLAARMVRPDPQDSPVKLADFRAATQRARFACVFTAHPTFSLPLPVADALAARACDPTRTERFASHRAPGITLEQEFEQAVAAIMRGRDALDVLAGALLDAAHAAWPAAWSDLAPAPIQLASWVGYDNDGRTDIQWWDTLRLRLRMKRLQLARLRGQIDGIASADPARLRVDAALDVIDQQIALCPATGALDGIAAIAEVLITQRDTALLSPAPLDALLRDAIKMAPDAQRQTLAVARAGLLAHGMSLAHTQIRLNAAQLHNVVRQRLGLSDPPEDASRRRALLAGIGAALDDVQPVAVDFGSLLAEQASAARLMMTVAQITKHIDTTTPIRFLIAETGTGYTLLAALWLARLFGVDRHIEISPLFETAEALEDGGRIVAEALRNPHYRDYLRHAGRIAVQFGYSDSGRYVGQLAATYLIERLRRKIVDALAQHGLSDIELIMFDTHGESVGRGAHPGSLRQRLEYLSPPAFRAALAQENILSRDESAFQGGDGYLLFGTPELALATVARIAEHVCLPVTASAPDPVYADPDFAADFFAAARVNMQALVEDAGYAALLGTFGPALLDPTGSRPASRQTDGLGGPAAISHPRELRAIPNNAILQQLGWMANTLHGLGAAAARHPESFAELRVGSPRLSNALDLAAHALAQSDLDVLRAVVATLDPGTWLDRAGHARLPRRREALVVVARALERLDLWAQTQAMFRRIQADHLALRAAWPDAPRMATAPVLLHALRLAVIHRIWLLAASVPDFSPRHGVTQAMLIQRLLRLDVPASIALLSEVFPRATDPAAERDYAEPHAPRATTAYAREHAEIFQPMQRLFDLLREIGAAITHEVGAFG